MGKYPIFIVNQLSHGPILALEDVNISFFLSLSLTHTQIMHFINERKNHQQSVELLKI
mgnify:CR=1 FL=1